MVTEQKSIRVVAGAGEETYEPVPEPVIEGDEDATSASLLKKCEKGRGHRWYRNESFRRIIKET